MAGRVQHGKVTVKRPWNSKARTIPADMWNSEQKPFQKQGYELVAPPVGVEAKPTTKPAGRPKKQVVEVEADEQPEINVEES